jgi:hypothetical protein
VPLQIRDGFVTGEFDALARAPARSEAEAGGSSPPPATGGEAARAYDAAIARAGNAAEREFLRGRRVAHARDG